MIILVFGIIIAVVVIVIIVKALSSGSDENDIYHSGNIVNNRMTPTEPPKTPQLPQPPQPLQPPHPPQPPKPPVTPQQQKTKAYWVVCSGGKLDRRIYLLEEELTIGRKRDRDICFGDSTPAVSRKHASIRINDGKVYLRDDGSSAGTFINNKGQIESLVPTELNVGDVFFIGSRANRFELILME